MANWTTIENAIRVWVKAGSGYGDSAVLWSDQTHARPSGAFITVRLGDTVPLGNDEVEVLTDLGADPGEEIELRAVGRRELSVSVQAFTPGVTGSSAGRGILSTVQTALALPSVRAALDAAGLTPFDVGSVRNISALVGTAFEGRAVLDVRFYTNDTASEFTGYIEDVEAVSYMGPPDEGTADEIDIP